MMPRRMTPFVILLLAASAAHADGPADNIPEKVRPVPAPGIAVPDEERTELETGLKALAKEIQTLRSAGAAKGKGVLLRYLPDVEIYFNAVHYALKYNEFYNKGEFAVARKLLAQGMQRAADLKAGKTPWTQATGLVVRGYVSKIDGSVQPYGLVVPASFRSGSAVKHRLDLWFHGRGEVLTELSFIDGRQKSPGQFTPPDTFVLHPYGRYCNANHFAGEIDTLEAIEHARRDYPIDEDRIVVRGFSMGGAACWNFAVHYADRWAAAAPGAGFSETPAFLREYQKETLKPAWYEEKLWNWYDCNRWALNLYHCPTVAYSGEIDSQKQAADVMDKALADEGMRLVHIIGPKTGHGYHPAAKLEIDRRIGLIAGKGRERMPRKVHLVTYTLRYPSMHWVRVEGMGEHWKEARVLAEILEAPAASAPRVTAPQVIRVKTSNVTALTLDMPPGYCPLDNAAPVFIEIDGDALKTAAPLSDRSWTVHLVRSGPRWSTVEQATLEKEVRKRPGLQGPIDDAFMDRFLMVRPTGKSVNEQVGRWVDGEMSHALTHWRKQFRGELKPKDDVDVTDADIASSNLVLWGDPTSNKVLARIAGKVPIAWNETIRVAGGKYAGDHHALILIAPNPLNPSKYVVLNSGFTFREYDYLNNARQVPKLPDWAVIDVSRPATSQFPGGIADAGFFDEHWQVKGK
ncbi:MAG: prolyl oligopeptidase family serine peptidase [Gemmataceae bacterium]